MFHNKSVENLILDSIILILFIWSVYFALNSFAGIDRDISGILKTYVIMQEFGEYNPSRFYGHPLAELIIGFLFTNFGFKISLFLILIIFYCSLFLLYKSFDISNNVIKLKFFIILSISNIQLLFDNMSLTDYPLSLLFFSIGVFLIKKKKELLFGIIFLSFSVACRMNFFLFVIIFLFYYFKLLNFNSFKYLFLLALISGLFYFPIFIEYKLTFNFISNKGGPDLSLGEILPRFIYKIIDLLGYLQFVIISIYFAIIYKKKKLKLDLATYLMVSNLLLFLLIPTKTSIISLFLILLYIILTKHFNKKVIIFIIILNLSNSFFYNFSFLKINYLNNDICAAKKALDAQIQFKIVKGKMYDLLKKSENNYKCIMREGKILIKYF